MEVLTLPKCAQHRRISTDIGDHAQFELRIVSDDEHVSGISDKASPHLSVTWDLLKIGVLTRKTSVHCTYLLEIGMDPPRLRVYMSGKWVQKGIFELGDVFVAQITDHCRMNILIRSLLR